MQIIQTKERVIKERIEEANWWEVWICYSYQRNGIDY